MSRIGHWFKTFVLKYWQNVKTKNKHTLKPDEKENKVSKEVLTYSCSPSDIIET